MMTIDFKAKIRPHRSYNGDKDKFNPENRSLRLFESDRGRIINSAAIRRLQQKTQVFPLERNAAVRSRLTHSMEVQQVGRFISQQIIEKLNKQGKLEAHGLAGLERQFESIVEMSCLMHDVGNPSFGHFGEAAMNQWFSENIRSLFLRKDLEEYKVGDEKSEYSGIKALKQDLTSFEGNAQALRIVQSLLSLNLTYSQISGIIKYTRRGDETKPEENDGKSYLKKKVGFYLSEAPFMTDVRQTLDMGEGCRSPFAYIMEAADDISYCIADIEDAVEKGVLKFDELLAKLEEEYQAFVNNPKFNIEGDDVKLMETLIAKNRRRYDMTKIEGDFFVSFRVAINTRSVDHASDQFIANIDAVFNGSYNNALLEDKSASHALLETLKKIAFKYVFCAREVEKRELQGYRIISGLLDIYKPLLALDRETFTRALENEKTAPLYEKRLAKKLSSKYISEYRRVLNELGSFKQHFSGTHLSDLSDNAWELYFRCRLIQDYISGMTDQFAYDEYRALNVIDY